MRKKLSQTLLVLFCCLNAQAQTSGIYDERSAQNIVWASKLKAQVEYLCDSLHQGRATGTKGGALTSLVLVGQFRDYGLLPLGGSYSQSFRTPDGKCAGHNVIGILHGNTNFDSYIVVGTHFDSIGMLDGKFYPGADSNASGVAALTTIVEMFSSMKKLGKTYDCNLIFVAFDGKQFNMAGAYSLFKALERGRLTDPATGKAITPDKVKLMVNIDQIGASLSPLKPDRRDYMIMLGAHSLPQDCRYLLSLCNKFYKINMQISTSYYGSASFTNIFYNISNQRPFVENGIPAVMFTSGITMNNNKTSDTPDTIDYEVLRKRIILIYHWIDRMTSAMQ